MSNPNAYPSDKPDYAAPFFARCLVRTDVSVAAKLGKAGTTPAVALVVISNGSEYPIYWAPSTARRYAAGLLNLADSIEGRTPLAFMPDCDKPHAGEVSLAQVWRDGHARCKCDRPGGTPCRNPYEEAGS